MNRSEWVTTIMSLVLGCCILVFGDNILVQPDALEPIPPTLPEGMEDEIREELFSGKLHRETLLVLTSVAECPTDLLEMTRWKQFVSEPSADRHLLVVVEGALAGEIPFIEETLGPRSHVLADSFGWYRAIQHNMSTPSTMLWRGARLVDVAFKP